MIASPGSKIGKYQIVSKLKAGAQGFVYVVKGNENDKLFVLKSMYVVESLKGELEKTIETWKRLCESKGKDFIVKFHEHFYQGENAIIIMEFCSGGDLDTLIKKRAGENGKFTEEEVIKVLIEVMSALEEMKILKFIHRDIKSANILIGSDGKYKMSDFNSSKVLESSGGASTLTGTLEYAAAEIAKSEEYSYEVDVWSVGVVLYQMMVGRTPFVNQRGVNMMNLIMGKYDPIPAASGYSQGLIEMVHSCLLLDPKQRPTPAQVLSSALVAAARPSNTVAAQENVALQAQIALLTSFLGRGGALDLAGKGTLLGASLLELAGLGVPNLSGARLLLAVGKGRWSMDEFIAKVSGKGPTLLLVEGAGRKVAGGYTPVGWGKEYQRAYDAGLSGFLFALHPTAVKFPHTDAKGSLFIDAGPAGRVLQFGGTPYRGDLWMNSETGDVGVCSNSYAGAARATVMIGAGNAEAGSVKHERIEVWKL